ncbi:matrixin family metalloprotease, partial [Thermodesulfobacteriota bacterium]
MRATCCGRCPAAAFLCVLALTLAAPPAPLRAYVLEGPVWSSSPTVVVNEARGPSGSLNAFIDALNTWTNVATSSFVFTYGGASSSHDFGTRDSINLGDFGDLSEYGSNVLGLTIFWFDGSNNYTDADVRLNTQRTWSTNSTPGTDDVFITALHEYGHVLGLDHSADSSALMYPVHTSQTGLGDDDIAGISALYPSDSSAWPDAAATMGLNTAVGDISSVTLTALSVALSTWTDVPASTFIYSATTTAATVAFNQSDNQSIAFFSDLTASQYLTNTVAYTNVWTSGSAITEADVIFNTDQCWTAGAVTGCYDMQTVALREFGYALGLDNSTTSGALLNPGTITTNVRLVTLTNDDRQAVSALYPRSYSSTGTNIRTAPYIIAADLDTDGRDDIVYISKKGYLYYTTDLKDWVKVGTNKFSKVAAGDFNADGDEDDLATINTKGLIKYTTDLSNYTTIGTNKFTDVASGDFSDSGSNKDIAAINNKGLLKFTTDRSNWQTIGTNKFRMLRTADVSDSGRAKDIVAINNKGLLKFTTDRSNWQTIGTNRFQTFAMADLSDNGTEKDIVAVNNRGLIKYTTDLSNWQTIGTNTFSAVAVGDFSGSGFHEDIAGLNTKGLVKYTTDLSNWSTIGTKQFRTLTAGDFDGDAATR